MANQVTLSDLLRRMEATWQRMGAKNPARTVLTDAAQVLIQQQEQIRALRAQAEPVLAEPPRLVTLA